MSSVEPCEGSGKIASVGEVGGAFIVSGDKSVVLLEFCENILGQMFGLLQVLIVFALFREI